MSGGGISTKRIVAGSTPSSFMQLADHQVLVAVLAGDGEGLPRRSRRLFAGEVLAHHHRRAVAMAEVGDLHLEPCSRSFMARGAIMKVASRRPLFTVSTTVGKSVKRCDSKRVRRLVLDA